MWFEDKLSWKLNEYLTDIISSNFSGFFHIITSFTLPNINNPILRAKILTFDALNVQQISWIIEDYFGSIERKYLSERFLGYNTSVDSSGEPLSVDLNQKFHRKMIYKLFTPLDIKIEDIPYLESNRVFHLNIPDFFDLELKSFYLRLPKKELFYSK